MILMTLDNKKNFDETLNHFKTEKEELIDSLNSFLEFKNKDISTKDQMAVRLEAFSLLLNIYNMIFSDELEHIIFLYQLPYQKWVEKLTIFINSVKNKKNDMCLNLDS